MGSHGILCYDTEEEVVQVFSSYLKGGLGRNEAVRLIAPTHDEYSDILRRGGIDARDMESDGRLRFLPMINLFARQGGVPLDIGSVSLSVRKLCQVDDGKFEGTRVISFSEHYLDYTSPDNVLRLERDLGRAFDLPLSLICAYDGRELIKRGLGEVLLSLFQHHGRIIGKELTLENLEQ